MFTKQKTLRALILGAILVAMSAGVALAVHELGIFQLDGNAVKDAAVNGEDWQNVYNKTSAALATTFLADGVTPNPDVSAYTGGGSKDDLDIPNWRWTSTLVPDKDDITNAYATAYVNNNNLILYFGADRFANNGDSQIGFWFFRNRVGLNPDGTFSGDHAVGDILILSDFTNGGKISTIKVYKWVGSGGSINGTLEFLGAGGDCTTAPNGDLACAMVNSAPVSSPWPYTPKFGSAGTFPTGSFFEGGINLTQLLHAQGMNVGCYSSFLAETRSSQSVDAVLKDIALGAFDLCAARVSITPPDATNEIGTNHTFTVKVEKKDAGTGYAWAPANNAPVTASLTNSNGANATFVGGNTCTTGANGTCTVTIRSTTTGTTTVSASANVSVGEEIRSVTTNGQDGNSAPANKLWVNVKIAIKKYTNGADADTAPGPYILAGFPVSWTYQVTNSGTVALSNIRVTDSKGVSVSCPKTALAVGESMTCTASGSADAGQYENIGTASGEFSGITVASNDPSHYFGATPVIRITKYTNGDDANTGTGPIIPVGGAVTWTYQAHNGGNVPLTDVSVTDSKGVSVSCPKTTLAAGETMTCTATGTAVEGQYENIGEVGGTPPGGLARQFASDPSHYFGARPSIKIMKSTNGDDANSPTGPYLLFGAPVNWAYVVTNTGNIALTGVQVTDDQGVSVSCPKAALALGESMTCTASGTAMAGQYKNIGKATGTPPGGLPPVATEDPSHYFGATPAIRITKSTNGDDANSGTGPLIPVGDAVTWTYDIRNVGNVTLTNVVVKDSKGVSVSCPSSTLAAGATMTCTASGVAVEGQYENIGEVEGTPPGGLAKQFASDPSHYFGARPSIKIVKSTNGDDANTPPGPSIFVGGAVNWTYVVTNNGNIALTGIQVTDDQGVSVICPQAALAPGDSMTCTASGSAKANQYKNIGKVTGTPPGGLPPVQSEDPSHYFGAAPTITIKKYTNDQDADSPTGPYILVGGAVTWKYVVTNTGNVALSNVKVTDDQGVAVTCPAPTLAVGASMTCTATGAAKPGQYKNIGTATGEYAGTPVSANDPSHYFGAAPALTIKKSTNGDDANTPPGPAISVGGAVNWTYLVTNNGNVTLTNIAVTDDKGVSITCPKTALNAGDSMTCTANGTATAGQYRNVGTATGTPPVGPNVSANDPSHYFGAAPAITIKKSVNGDDANTPPGPYISVGGAVNWTYLVANSGNIALSNVKVTDDKGVPVTCPKTTLNAGESMTCTASGTATAGQYKNIGTATGEFDGITVKAEDPAHYFGAAPKISIIKSANGDDANAPPGPTIPVGSVVNWTYAVTNNGNVPLVSIAVTDDKVNAVTCPKTALDAGESMTCTANGTATAGQYKNIGTATGKFGGATVTANDPAHYFGAAAAIAIVKSVNGDDANNPSGPYISVGSAVNWTYKVTNNGNVPLSNVKVTDDQNIAVTCPGTALAVGASMTCTASGTAIAGQYKNIGMATGEYAGTTVNASDPAYYFGTTVAIDLTKFVSVDNKSSWDDANSATGPVAFVGDPVYFKFVVKNTGNVPLATLTLSDNVYSTSTCAVPSALAPDASFECVIGPISATKDQHTNTATAGGVFGGKTVSDKDSANYFGAAPSVDIEKFVSVDEKATWADADAPTGPQVRASVNVYFKFVVKNTGNVPLSNVTLSDNVYSTSACVVPSALAPGASFECVIGPFAATFGQHTNTGTATGAYGGKTYSDKDDANYYGIAAYGKIAPTQTTCQMFVSGTSADLNELLYGVKGTKINNVAPGVLFYYTRFTAQSASFTVTIEQTKNGATPYFGVQQNNQVSLYNADCSTSRLGKVTIANGQVQIAITGATVGKDYVVGIKYDPGTVVGASVPSPTTVHYDFKTKIGVNVVDQDMNGLDLKKK